ncbi:chloroplastic-like isoform B [Chlorella sorokiniana]|uniref:Chloroplastic-like isoform A n=1 Tax=Chlorella sorokiniana TaxID=3076 RepID=A0A2P6U004_CHLSO|nr:chloroplastic-like isoform A [Chlorella sorokiniana]PRW59642.1 chloroplastic-like isoform B [Chlorella sorokiniana]|eukprot:PRW59641.1 chloroplastic-like isoform A [Chlorella sorokiniana]
MLLRQLTARMVVPGAKAAAGMTPLLHPMALRAASSVAGAWAPVAPKQQAAARGQQQQVQSYTYEPVGMEAAAEIGEVDFDPAAANSVRLIGVVGNKKELRVFERSKLLPFSIGVKFDRRRDEVEWINVEAWGPLAERAEAVLQKGDRVAVQGRLRLNKWEDAAGTKRSSWRITANSISKVRSNYPAGSGGAGDGGSFDDYALPAASTASAPGPAPWDLPTEPAGAPAAGQVWQAEQGQQVLTTEQKWMDFFEDTSKWWDNRSSKTNPKAPDFKKKGGRDAPALWIKGKDTPAWVEGELERMDSGAQ